MGSSGIDRRSPANQGGAIAVTRQRPRPATAISCASRRLPATTYEWPAVTRWRSAGTPRLIALRLFPQRPPAPERRARHGTPVAPDAWKAATDFAHDPPRAAGVVNPPCAPHPE